MRTTYDINVTRDGRWWMVEIPNIGLTQTRRLGEVEQMAQEYIAVTLDVPISSVTTSIAHIRVGDADVTEVRAEVEELRKTAREAEGKAAALMRATAANLSAAEVPIRDIGTVLGVSFQRADQLVKS